MNLQQLRYLVATADHGTMTAAAQACHVAQPALSRAIRSLERELGLTLFARRGRGVELTPDGHDVLLTARLVVDGAASIEDLGRRRYASRSLILAMTRSNQADLGSGAIERLWASHPDIAVRIVTCEDNTEVCMTVAEGRADAGIADLPATGPLETVSFEEREVVVLTPPGSDLPDPVTMTELGGVPLVVPARGGSRRSQLESGFAAAGVASLRIGFESDDRSTWPAAVLAGVGSCLWYRSSAAEAAERGVRLLRLDPPRWVTLGAVHRPQPPPVVRDFLDLLR